MNRKLCNSLGVMLFVGQILVGNAHGDDFTVTNTGDIGDGSLRWAIEQANTNIGADKILFYLPPTACGGTYCVFTPATTLPVLTDNQTTIDGYSQPYAVMASNDTPAVLKIMIRGTSAGLANGLNIASDNNLIQGLNINRFSGNGIMIGNAATGNRIEGNHIGTNIDGSEALGNGLNGVFIAEGASSNTIGYCCPHSPCSDEGAEERNILSGNGWSGIEIHGVGTDQNSIGHNYIGTTASGSDALGNTMHGIRIYGAAKENDIQNRPIIGGNTLDGIRIAGWDTTGNVIGGAHIGLRVKRVLTPPFHYEFIPVANGENGVTVIDGAQETLIEKCFIGNNGGHGVEMSGTGTDNNTVKSSYVGLYPSYTLGSVIYPAQNAGNGGHGVYINLESSGNHIGLCSELSDSCEGNIISGNNRWGILITGLSTTDNTVIGNFIGTDNLGMIALGNVEGGVAISSGSYENIIGGSHPDFELGNIIAGNSGDGILLWEAHGNIIMGNSIGVNTDGSATIPNSGDGIVLAAGSRENFIYSGNVIVGSGEHGISIIEGSNKNLIADNYIGTNAQGLVAGNSGAGVSIVAEAAGGPISDTVVRKNTIANNNGGVVIDNELATRNWVKKNSIYNNLGLGIDLKNGANSGIAVPVITANSLKPLTVSGSASPGCMIEIFSSSSNDGEGEVFIGRTFTDGRGEFNASVTSLPYRYLTATVTDLQYNTSEFSAVYSAKMPFSWGMFLPAITGSGGGLK